MKGEPLVSIALCTYNGEKYISQQLDSILAQTYHNLEIIIADDCSADNTFNIVNDYAKKDNRIKCFRNEFNIGFNKNFEQAIKLTTGEYIAISDQDDIWLSKKIELLLNSICDNWLVFSNSSFINNDNEVVEGEIFNGFNPDGCDYKSILLANFVTGHTTLFKREFINRFLPFPSEGFYDWWLGFTALYHHKITYLDEVLTQYRIHDASVMQQRVNSGREKQEENKMICIMLSNFSVYKNLEDRDHVFIEQVKCAYKQVLYRRGAIPLIKILFKNYAQLFPRFKQRRHFSLLNFAIKYAGKVKK